MKLKVYLPSAAVRLSEGAALRLAAAPRSLRPAYGVGDPACPVCLGKGYLSRDVPVGHPDFGRAFPCRCRQAEIDQARAENLPRLSNLLPHELDFRLYQLSDRGESTQAMIRAACEFLDSPYGLLTLWGRPGNGKSFVLKALVNHFNERRYGQAYYARFTDLLDLLHETHSGEASRRALDLYARLKNIWFLAIDDLDEAAPADWAGEFQARFFDYRYRLAREGVAHTALALNHDPARLPGSLYDRLSWGLARPGGFRILENNDPSARPLGM